MLVACAGNAKDVKDMATHPFTLYVSNQSLVVSPVDIEVRIDGEVVVVREFEVGSQTRIQHQWHEFKVELESGPHRLEVSSQRGDARLEREFALDGPTWATLGYWSARETRGTDRQGARFTVELSDRPVGFY